MCLLCPSESVLGNLCVQTVQGDCVSGNLEKFYRALYRVSELRNEQQNDFVSSISALLSLKGRLILDCEIGKVNHTHSKNWDKGDNKIFLLGTTTTARRKWAVNIDEIGYIWPVRAAISLMAAGARPDFLWLYKDYSQSHKTGAQATTACCAKDMTY